MGFEWCVRTVEEIRSMINKLEENIKEIKESEPEPDSGYHYFCYELGFYVKELKDALRGVKPSLSGETYLWLADISYSILDDYNSF